MEQGVIVSIISVVVGAAVTSVMTIIGYFAKTTLESMQSDIEEVKKDIKDQRGEMKKEHAVAVGWMTEITRALRKNGIEVERPKEVQEQINIEMDDD